MSILDIALSTARMRYPDATEIHVNKVEFEGATAHVDITVRLPPRLEYVIDVQIVPEDK